MPNKVRLAPLQPGNRPTFPPGPARLEQYGALVRHSSKAVALVQALLRDVLIQRPPDYLQFMHVALGAAIAERDGQSSSSADLRQTIERLEREIDRLRLALMQQSSDGNVPSSVAANDADAEAFGMVCRLVLETSAQPVFRDVAEALFVADMKASGKEVLARCAEHFAAAAAAAQARPAGTCTLAHLAEANDGLRGECAARSAEIAELRDALAVRDAELATRDEENAELHAKIAELQAEKEHARVAQLPPLLRGYTEPKLNLAEAAAPVLALQEKLLEASTNAVESAARAELAKAQATLQQNVLQELWTQLGGLECRTKTARLTSLAEVMGASNSRFHGVYSQIVEGIKSDNPKAFAAFVGEATAIRDMCKAEKRVCRQGTEDAIEILLQAKRVGPGFAKLLEAVAQSVEGVTHKVGPLKKLYRMVEKTALRTENCGGLSEDGASLQVAFNFGRVCDVRRGFVQCDGFAQLAAVLAALRQMEKDGTIVIRRIKDRFSTPSAGGWADCMVNFSLAADPDGHVCELQCVHAQLMLARKELGGHQIYGKGRAAAELLELAAAVVPEAWHVRIALLCFREHAKMHGLELQGEFKAKGWEGWGAEKELAEWNGVWTKDPVLTPVTMVRVVQADAMTDLMAATLAFVPDLVRKLQSINLYCCRQVMDVGVGWLAKHCPQLQSIDLGMCDEVTDVSVLELLKMCKDLKAIKGVPDKMLAVYKDVILLKKQLQSIDLSGSKNVTDVGVGELAKHCPQLQSINLTLCKEVTDVGVGELAKHCPQLQSIDLSYCDKVTDVGVGELAKHCPKCEVA